MSAAPEQAPAPRFRWAAKNNRHHPVAGGRLMTAQECVVALVNDPHRLQECTAEVVEGRTDCVRVVRPFLSKPVLYHGEHPNLTASAGSEPDARRALIRMREDYAQDWARVNRRLLASQHVKHADRREAAVLGDVVERLDRELAVLADPSETAVEAR